MKHFKSKFRYYRATYKAIADFIIKSVNPKNEWDYTFRLTDSDGTVTKVKTVEDRGNKILIAVDGYDDDIAGTSDSEEFAGLYIYFVTHDKKSVERFFNAIDISFPFSSQEDRDLLMYVSKWLES